MFKKLQIWQLFFAFCTSMNFVQASKLPKRPNDFPKQLYECMEKNSIRDSSRTPFSDFAYNTDDLKKRYGHNFHYDPTERSWKNYDNATTASILKICIIEKKVVSEYHRQYKKYYLQSIAYDKAMEKHNQ